MEIPSIHPIGTNNPISNTKRNTKENNTFASVLEENTSINNTYAQEQNNGVTQLMQSALMNNVTLVSSTGKTPEDAMEVILNVIEQYATSLADTNNQKSLPELHTELEKAEKEMEAFRSLYSIEENSPLFSIFNSIEILLLRERYRFNKGSYSL